MKLKIQALDTLFFGDGRPFTMGDDSWSSDIFPPYPSTVYGMMRGVYFKEKMSDFAKADTPNDPTKDLEINFFGLELKTEKETTELFPFPLDIVKNETQDQLVNLELQEKQHFFSEYSLSHQLLPQKNMFNDKIRNADSSYYLTTKEFENYLEGKEIDQEKLVKLDDYISLEPKIGISRDRYDVDNKKLYRINQTRPESIKGNLYFVLDFKSLVLKENAFFSRLGGEGKLAYLNEYKVNNDLKVKINTHTEIVKMYLASPAIYKSGWKPSFGVFDKEVEVIACAMGKQLHIGGWNAKKKQPRPMYKAVPAGSVYFLRGNTDTIKKLIDTYHGKKLPQENDYAKQGFGLVYFGNITKQKK